MIVVKVELHSARTGKVSDLGTVQIWNKGGTEARGDYGCRAYPKGARFRHGIAPEHFREGEVNGHPRKAEHVLNLVSKALQSMRFGRPA